MLCFCFSNTAADVLCTYVPELTSSNSSKKQIFQNFLALTTALQNADKKVALSTRRKIFATTNTRWLQCKRPVFSPTRYCARNFLCKPENTARSSINLFAKLIRESKKFCHRTVPVLPIGRHLRPNFWKRKFLVGVNRSRGDKTHLINSLVSHFIHYSEWADKVRQYKCGWAKSQINHTCMKQRRIVWNKEELYELRIVWNKKNWMN